MTRVLGCLMMMMISLTSQAQEEVLLYTHVPNSKPVENVEKTEMRSDGVALVHAVSEPILTVFKAIRNDQEPTPAIIICPGGGYQYLAFNKEGTDVAKSLNAWGITAFVLKYRLPDAHIMENKSMGPLQDAERAMQWVREHAADYNIDPQKVGIMGFSAGGHLASTLSTHFNQEVIDNPKQTSFRPDFSVLIYPVISFSDSLTHKGSRERLIGPGATEEEIAAFSNDLRVSKDTPPAFLVHAKDDTGVPWENSERYYQALINYGIESEVVYYPTGGHGFGMFNQSVDQSWMPELKAWLKKQGFL